MTSEILRKVVEGRLRKRRSEMIKFTAHDSSVLCFLAQRPLTAQLESFYNSLSIDGRLVAEYIVLGQHTNNHDIVNVGKEFIRWAKELSQRAEENKHKCPTCGRKYE